jgi:hypothetical protein
MSDHPPLKGLEPTIGPESINNDVFQTATLNRLKKEFGEGTLHSFGYFP